MHNSRIVHQCRLVNITPLAWQYHLVKVPHQGVERFPHTFAPHGVSMARGYYFRFQVRELLQGHGCREPVAGKTLWADQRAFLAVITLR